MWFITKNILEYLCNEDIPKEKRIKYIKNNKNKVMDELIKLSPEELINMLFNSKVLKELKVVICEGINDLSTKYDDSSKNTRKVLLSKFKDLNNYKERYIISDTCPDIFKKEIIEKLYNDKPYDVVKKGKVSKKIKKVIMKLCLSRYQLERLLDRDIPYDLKLYIVDECFDSDYDLRSALSNDKIADEFKERIIEKRVDKDNLFKFLEYANQSTIEYVLSMKSKEFNEYLNGLTTSNILKVMGNTSTPKYLLEYIFKYKEDVIIKAVDRAWRNDLEQIIRWERNVALLKMVYERRPKAVYRVIDKLYDFQLMDFLGLTYLPDEYKDYIVNKRKWTLMGYINRLSAWDAIKILKTDCNVPQDIKDKVFEKKQKIILEHYAKEDDKEIVRTIRYGSLDYVLKKLLIQERINIHNIFVLLGELYIDKGTVDLVVELKKDILTQILLAHDNDKLFKGKFDVLSRDVIESIYAGNEETLKQRVDLLSEDELYNYLNNDKVVGVVKKLILVRLGIEVDNVNNVLLLINMYDTELVLDNYDNIRDFIYGLGIDFNSFLQYGSGSKKHSKWFDNLLEVINNDDIGDFAFCKDYMFINYYNVKSENSVYIISSFLEFLDNYSKYKELFMNLIKGKVKLTKEDKDNLKFLFNVSGVSKDNVPTSIYDLKKFKLELYKNYIHQINSSSCSIYTLQNIFNDVLFCNAKDILSNIGGTGALRTLKKDNINSPSVVGYINELMLYSSIIEMVNYTNNEEGLKNVLTYIFSDIDLLSKIQNMFANFEEKVRRLYELDSMNNLTTLNEARRLGMYNTELAQVYGGEVFDYSDKNYCLYGHILSSKENIVDVLDGVSTGNSNFISVSPVSYRGQKYYFDRDDVVIAYDRLPVGSFICSSVSNMATNYSVTANSSEVDDIRRSQRGILETSAVVERNAEALLYREGLKPCGLILPGGRKPSKRELEYHEKYNLPFIITQPLHQSIDDPKYVFVNDLDLGSINTDLSELEKIMDMLRPNVTHVKESMDYTGREIGVIADCHSMYEPTLAVLEDMRRRGITEIYSLGDNIGLGPNPVEVFDLLDEFNVQSVAGNAEYYNTIGTDAFPYLTDARLESQLWTERKLGPERISNLREYPASRDLLLGNKKVALCHFANVVRWDFRERSVHSYASSHGSNVEQLRYTNSEDAIRKITNCIVSNRGSVSAVKGYMASKDEPIFGGKKVTDYDYVLQGHYHFDLEDTLDDTEVYTLRAVGMGYEGTEKDNEACYYVLRERKDGDIEIDKVYVPFNRNALLSSIHTCDLPSKDRVLSYVKKSR